MPNHYAAHQIAANREQRACVRPSAHRESLRRVARPESGLRSRAAMHTDGRLTAKHVAKLTMLRARFPSGSPLGAATMVDGLVPDGLKDGSEVRASERSSCSFSASGRSIRWRTFARPSVIHSARAFAGRARTRRVQDADTSTPRSRWRGSRSEAWPLGGRVRAVGARGRPNAIASRMRLADGARNGAKHEHGDRRRAGQRRAKLGEGE